MTKMEAKLQEVWGSSTLVFCKQCGVPTAYSNCSHEQSAPWADLNERQRARVRRQAIQKAKADRLAGTFITAAS